MNSPGIISRSSRNHGPSCGKVSWPCHLGDRRTGHQPGPRRETCSQADSRGVETVWRPAPNTRRRKIRKLFPARSLARRIAFVQGTVQSRAFPGDSRGEAPTACSLRLLNRRGHRRCRAPSWVSMAWTDGP